MVGDGWVSWQRNDSDRIDLVADKALYDVGETAKILVKSPFPTAEAVLTVEREGVQSVRHVVLKGAATTLDVPVGEATASRTSTWAWCWCAAASPRPTAQDSGRRSRSAASAGGLRRLKVEKKSKRLAVEVTPERDRAPARGRR